jgi:hypothetical protein
MKGVIGAYSNRIIRGALIVLAVCVVSFIVLVAFRIPVVAQRDASAKKVVDIRAQRLTLSDVDGKHLPPPLDAATARTTLAGVDANGNGIRDDVEFALFASTTDPKLRAAELQYAMSLQHLLNGDVFSKETLEAVDWNWERGYFCINDAIPVVNKDFDTQDKKFNAVIKFVDGLIFNTDERKDYKEKMYDAYMSSRSSPRGDYCDITQYP